MSDTCRPPLNRTLLVARRLRILAEMEEWESGRMQRKGFRSGATVYGDRSTQCRKDSMSRHDMDMREKLEELTGQLAAVDALVEELRLVR